MEELRVIRMATETKKRHVTEEFRRLHDLKTAGLLAVMVVIVRQYVVANTTLQEVDGVVKHEFYLRLYSQKYTNACSARSAQPGERPLSHTYVCSRFCLRVQRGSIVFATSPTSTLTFRRQCEAIILRIVLQTRHFESNENKRP